jgi:hypothetical protein
MHKWEEKSIAYELKMQRRRKFGKALRNVEEIINRRFQQEREGWLTELMEKREMMAEYIDDVIYNYRDKIEEYCKILMNYGVNWEWKDDK